MSYSLDVEDEAGGRHYLKIDQNLFDQIQGYVGASFADCRQSPFGLEVVRIHLPADFVSAPDVFTPKFR